MFVNDRIMDPLDSFASQFDSLRTIKAINAAFATLMPVAIVGAFSVLINNRVRNPKNSLASFAFFAPLAVLESMIASSNYATLSVLFIGAGF